MHTVAHVAFLTLFVVFSTCGTHPLFEPAPHPRQTHRSPFLTHRATRCDDLPERDVPISAPNLLHRSIAFNCLILLVRPLHFVTSHVTNAGIQHIRGRGTLRNGDGPPLSPANRGTLRDSGWAGTLGDSDRPPSESPEKCPFSHHHICPNLHRITPSIVLIQPTYTFSRSTKQIRAPADAGTQNFGPILITATA